MVLQLPQEYKEKVLISEKNNKQWVISETLTKGAVILEGEYYASVSEYKRGCATVIKCIADKVVNEGEEYYVFVKGDYLLACDAATAAAKDLAAANELADEVAKGQAAVARGAVEAKEVENIEKIGRDAEKVGQLFGGTLRMYVDYELIRDAATRNIATKPNPSGSSDFDCEQLFNDKVLTTIKEM